MPLAQSGGSNVGSAQIIDGEIINDDVNAAAGIEISKLNFGTGITSSEINESVLKVDEITITAAQIKTLFSSPKVLVAAPGVGKVVLPEFICIRFNYVAPQYTSGGTLRFQYNGETTSIANASIISADIVAATSFTKYYRFTASIYAIDVKENKAIELYNQDGIEYATGNGTIKAFIKYRIITL